MKNITNRFSLMIASLIACLSISGLDAETQEANLDLPPAWLAAPPQELLSARRAAELDALRRLGEEIYGVRIDSKSSVIDSVLENDELRGMMHAFIRGVVSSNEVHYLPDKTVKVIRRVLVRDVIEELTREVKRIEKNGRVVSLKESESTTLSYRDTWVEAEGYGAVADSPGLPLLQARRAAEVAAYRNLAERVLGVDISSQTRVSKMAQASDKVCARLEQVVRGARVKSVTFARTTSVFCEVTLELKESDLFDSLSRYVEKAEDKAALAAARQDAKEGKVFTATGSGTPRPRGGINPPVSGTEEEMFPDTGRGFVFEILNQKVQTQ